jgi:predicted NAD/FAD-binding protein
LQLLFNPEIYRNFYRFLELQKLTGHLISNATTFSVSTDGGTFEWAGKSVLNLLCNISSITDLGMWRMVFDIARFKACAVRVLSEDGEPTIEAYVKREGYSTQFKDMFLIVCNRTHPHLCGRFGSES